MRYNKTMKDLTLTNLISKLKGVDDSAPCLSLISKLQEIHNSEGELPVSIIDYTDSTEKQ